MLLTTQITIKNGKCVMCENGIYAPIFGNSMMIINYEIERDMEDLEIKAGKKPRCDFVVIKEDDQKKKFLIYMIELKGNFTNKNGKTFNKIVQQIREKMNVSYGMLKKWNLPVFTNNNSSFIAVLYTENLNSIRNMLNKSLNKSVNFKFVFMESGDHL